MTIKSELKKKIVKTIFILIPRQECTVNSDLTKNLWRILIPIVHDQAFGNLLMIAQLLVGFNF